MLKKYQKHGALVICGLGAAKQVGAGAARCRALFGLDFCFFLSRKRKSRNRLANMALCTFFLIKKYQKIKAKQMLARRAAPAPTCLAAPSPHIIVG